MRMSEHCRHIPVFILSSSDAERDKADAARFGASRHLRKPSKLDDFLGGNFQSGSLRAGTVRERRLFRSSPGNFAARI
jgi:CheY-like chemotaxis protein